MQTGLESLIKSSRPNSLVKTKDQRI